MSRGSASRGYHHGDLRETLLETALERIEAHGTESLSLRALARQAGVSATAPYRHFPSKRCLLAALITRGFRALERALRAASTNAGEDPVERLIAASLAYVDFARDNPTSYHLMFSTVIGDFSDYEDLIRASGDAYGVVLGLLDDVLAAPGAPPLTTSQAGGITWAAVHGLSSLLLFGRDRAGQSSSAPMNSLALLEQDPEQALRLLIRGIVG